MSGATQVRALGPADADALLELSAACDIDTLGESVSTAEEIDGDLSHPELEMVGIDGESGIDGYAWFSTRDTNEKVWSDVRVRPGRFDLFAPLLAWTRDQLAAIGNGRAQWIFADSADAQKCAALEAAGGTVVRRFHRMLIVLDPAAPPAPIGLPGVEIRLMREDEADRRAVCRIVETAFRDHFGSEAETFEQWDVDRLSACPDPTLYWIASVDGEPAAALYAAELPAAGYIDTLGTLREFRGRGLGRALLESAFVEFHRREVYRVTLGVDATSPTGARGLYVSAGMSMTHEGWRYELPPADEEPTCPS